MKTTSIEDKIEKESFSGQWLMFQVIISYMTLMKLTQHFKKIFSSCMHFIFMQTVT